MNEIEKDIKLKEKCFAILEVFENFLYEKGINIPNDEKEGDENAAIIYGTDYGNLEDEVMELLKE